MSIDEEEIKTDIKSSDELLSEKELEVNEVSDSSEVMSGFNEEIIALNSEQIIIKDEAKEDVKNEIIIKNPRPKKDKKAVEYIEDDDYSGKAWSITLVLCVFLGFIGFHRFYVGKAGTAILMLLTFGGFGIWVLVDLIRIAINNFTDEEGKVVKRISLAS